MGKWGRWVGQREISNNLKTKWRSGEGETRV